MSDELLSTGSPTRPITSSTNSLRRMLAGRSFPLIQTQPPSHRFPVVFQQHYMNPVSTSLRSPGPARLSTRARHLPVPPRLVTYRRTVLQGDFPIHFASLPTPRLPRRSPIERILNFGEPKSRDNSPRRCSLSSGPLFDLYTHHFHLSRPSPRPRLHLCPRQVIHVISRCRSSTLRFQSLSNLTPSVSPRSTTTSASTPHHAQWHHHLQDLYSRPPVPGPDTSTRHIAQTSRSLRRILPPNTVASRAEDHPRRAEVYGTPCRPQGQQTPWATPPKHPSQDAAVSCTWSPPTLPPHPHPRFLHLSTTVPPSPTDITSVKSLAKTTASPAIHHRRTPHHRFYRPSPPFPTSKCIITPWLRRRFCPWLFSLARTQVHY